MKWILLALCCPQDRCYTKHCMCVCYRCRNCEDCAPVWWSGNPGYAVPKLVAEHFRRELTTGRPERAQQQAAPNPLQPTLRLEDRDYGKRSQWGDHRQGRAFIKTLNGTCAQS